tara:strand:+ start:503 stop:1000 length:498 start_codon:yes stop_codon:yes gene_type:complete
MSQGTPISNLKKNNNLVNDIMSDYNSKHSNGTPSHQQQLPQPQQSQEQHQPQQSTQYDPTPPLPIPNQQLQEHPQEQQQYQQDPQQDIEEYYDYEPETYDKQGDPNLLDELKPIIIFFLLFVVLNYMPIVSLIDNLLIRVNIPYIGLIIRAIVGAILFFFIKKFI